MPNAKPEDYADMDQDKFDALMATGFGLSGVPGSAEYLADAVEALSVAHDTRLFIDYEAEAETSGYARPAADHQNISRLQAAADYAAAVLKAVAADPELRRAVADAVRRDADGAARQAADRKKAALRHVIEEHFVHLGYDHVQAVMGVRDGGYADLFDDEPTVGYGSIIGNQAGADILSVVYDTVGEEEFLKRAPALFPNPSAPPRDAIPYDPVPGWFEGIGRDSADHVITRVTEVYPEVAAESLMPFRARMAEIATAYAKGEYVAAVKGEHRDGGTKPWTGERRRFVVDVLDNYFSHCIYGIVHDALGIEDGDVAGVHESDASAPYEGAFGNAVGGRILEAVIEDAGQQAVAERQERLFKAAGHGVVAGQDMSEEETAEFCGRVADAVVDHVHSVFPEVRRGSLDQFKGKLAEFAGSYVRMERMYDEQAKPGM